MTLSLTRLIELLSVSITYIGILIASLSEKSGNLAINMVDQVKENFKEFTDVFVLI